MIIERMRATFGKLDDRELTLQPGLNVVTGDNETGKSTWLAFLLAMLYGVDTRERSGRNRLPDKQKFLPWSGKPMAGSMELRADDGRRVTLERSSETGPLADFQAWDTDSGSPREDLTGRSCGRQLLGVEAAVYVRSGYLRQQRIAVSADPRLEKRLSGLVSGGSEDYSYSEADEALKKLQTALRHNQSGALPKAEAAREALREKLARAEEHQGRLAKLEAELHELNRQRNEAREALACLDALERREREQKLRELEAQLAAAREDREGWQAVCDGQPPRRSCWSWSPSCSSSRASSKRPPSRRAWPWASWSCRPRTRSSDGWTPARPTTRPPRTPPWSGRPWPRNRPCGSKNPSG